MALKKKKMTRQEVIDELSVFVSWYSEETGAVPLCMVEAIRLLEKDGEEEKR